MKGYLSQIELKLARKTHELLHVGGIAITKSSSIKKLSQYGTSSVCVIIRIRIKFVDFSKRY